MIKRVRDHSIGQHYDVEHDLTILTPLVSHFSDDREINYEFPKKKEN